MNKLFTAALGLAVAVLPVLGVGVATAAEEPANCADAVTVLASADAAHKAAVAADQAVVDAEDADQALKDARADRNQAKNRLERAEFELSELPPTAPDSVRRAAERKVERLTNELEDAQEKVDDAKEAAEAKTRKLREEADKTDAVALEAELTAAREDFNRLCTEGQDGSTADEFDCNDFPLADGRSSQNVLDADRNDPHNLDADGDGVACEVDEGSDNSGDDNDSESVSNGGSDSVVTPAGGVNTGGWRK